jgi:RNA polymerase sigma-70 factor (ECF subfamily)
MMLAAEHSIGSFMADSKPAAPPSSGVDQTRSQVSTRALVLRARLGDASAGDRLFTRVVRRVRSWARGQLPQEARAITDTVDIVQDAAAGAWRNFGRIDVEHPGGLEAYLRQAVRNRIRDEARRVGRQPPSLQLDSQMADEAPTPLERALSGETSAQFRAAFAQLTDDQRELILARHEYGYSYERVAALLDKPNAGAACSAVNRAVARLDSLMRAFRD